MHKQKGAFGLLFYLKGMNLMKTPKCKKCLYHMQKESETEMQETYYCSLCNSHFSQLKKEYQRPRPKIAPNRFYY